MRNYINLNKKQCCYQQFWSSWELCHINREPIEILVQFLAASDAFAAINVCFNHICIVALLLSTCNCIRWVRHAALSARACRRVLMVNGHGMAGDCECTRMHRKRYWPLMCWIWGNYYYCVESYQQCHQILMSQGLFVSAADVVWPCPGVVGLQLSPNSLD